jgi:hypothetical protein
MFTQPHKPLGRHFSILPEWGLHAGIKHAALWLVKYVVYGILICLVNCKSVL